MTSQNGDKNPSNQNSLSDQDDLERKKLKMEVEKLELEVKRGRKPWFFQAGFLTVVLVTLLTTGINWFVNGDGIKAKLELDQINLEKKKHELEDQQEEIEAKIAGLQPLEDSLLRKGKALVALADDVAAINDLSVAIQQFNSAKTQAEALESVTKYLVRSLENLEEGGIAEKKNKWNVAETERAYREAIDSVREALRFYAQHEFQHPILQKLDLKSTISKDLKEINKMREFGDKDLNSVFLSVQSQTIPTGWRPLRKNYFAIQNFALDSRQLQQVLEGYLLFSIRELNFLLGKLQVEMENH